jgi:hypothetical protein
LRPYSFDEQRSINFVTEFAVAARAEAVATCQIHGIVIVRQSIGRKFHTSCAGHIFCLSRMLIGYSLRALCALGRLADEDASLSIRSKLLIVLLLIGLADLGVGGGLGYDAGRSTLFPAVDQRLWGTREVKRLRPEAYLANQIRFASTIGNSAAAMDASAAFIAERSIETL